LETFLRHHALVKAGERCRTNTPKSTNQSQLLDGRQLFTNA
jgi:hypothetical protein